MESYNLNTMNSYLVPASSLPRNEAGEVDLASYIAVAKDTSRPTAIITNGYSDASASTVIHFMSSYV